MKYDLVSDLHLDSNSKQGVFFDFETLKNKDSDILIVAGDVADNKFDTLSFMQRASFYYQYVFFVDGNHDNYHTSPIEENEYSFKRMAKKYDNIIYLNGTEIYVINDVAFIGCNGWYDFVMTKNKRSFEEIKKFWMNTKEDYKFVDYGIYDNPFVLSKVHSTRIKSNLKKINSDKSISKVIIATHSCPSSKLFDSFERPGWSKFMSDEDFENTSCFFNNNSYFDTDMKLYSKVTHWNFGHTHHRKNNLSIGSKFFNKNKIKFHTNSFGYIQEGLEPFQMMQISI